MARVLQSAILVLGLITLACGEDEEKQEIWQPGLGTTWNWQLFGDIDTSFEVEMYDVDLFETPQKVINKLQDDGRIVICYFSAGSFEEWRDDADQFPDEVIGEPLPEWEGEYWLDLTSQDVRDIMLDRLDVAVDKGCDGVEPDNVDGFINDNGFDLTYEDQLDFNTFIAGAAHERGLSVGLKNDLDQIEDLVDDFDWALNEECYFYDECEMYEPFLWADKAVFHVEYVDDKADGPDLADEICGSEAIMDFSTLIKEWDLYAWHISCEEW